MNFIQSALNFLANNPALASMAVSAVGKLAPALSPALAGLSALLLKTAPVDPSTNKPIATTDHPTDAVTILQELINLAQSLVFPGTPAITVDGVYGPATYAAAKALLAKGGVTI